MNRLSNKDCPPKGLLVVISGPSGVGKGTICRELMSKYSDISYSVSATTRKPRPGEVHGKDYFFYDTEGFLELIAKDALLEWAKVYDNYYGTPVAFVEELLRQGQDCILEIDIQGAMQVKGKKPEAVYIFIMPPSKEELIRRITLRGTENQAEIEKRMGQVDHEMDLSSSYDYVVVNDDVMSAVVRIRDIITAERLKVKNK